MVRFISFFAILGLYRVAHAAEEACDIEQFMGRTFYQSFPLAEACVKVDFFAGGKIYFSPDVSCNTNNFSAISNFSTSSGNSANYTGAFAGKISVNQDTSI